MMYRVLYLDRFIIPKFAQTLFNSGMRSSRIYDGTRTIHTRKTSDISVADFDQTLCHGPLEKRSKAFEPKHKHSFGFWKMVDFVLFRFYDHVTTNVCLKWTP